MNQDREPKAPAAGEPISPPTTPAANPDDGSGLNRRQFLGGVGGTAVGASLAGGLTGLGALSGVVASPAHAVEIAPQSPQDRRNTAFQIKHDAAIDEKQLGWIDHPTNGDEELYSNRIGSFHKTLPHDANGEVDPAAYNALLAAAESGDFADWEALPGGPTRLLNPVGGLAFNMEGPDSAAVGVNPPPPLASQELAAQAAEAYWMALLRDVPFADWNTDPDVQAACDSLNAYPGYTGPVDPVLGIVTPQVLFRADYPGVLDGPMVSQFLLRSFFYDAIPVVPRMRVSAQGADFMTEFGEWLNIQNGTLAGAFPPLDPVSRFPRSPRDLGLKAQLDRIYSVYFRAYLILQAFIPFAGHPGLDANHPYRTSARQSGFATFGTAHISEMLAAVGKSERHTWYQKWQVHRFLRPEAYGGLVHRVLADGAGYPIHNDLLSDTDLMQRVFDHNAARNQARGFGPVGTYLLPQMFPAGSPSHPSFPAGHAVTAGASCTVLKAFFNEDLPFPGPVKVSADGLSLSPYVAGVDGPTLTLGSELNKLMHNLT
ncbi:MAG TPA: hypothetical protein VLF66_19695, partial [Thermoanaerobaculia bacterium]|nr:hypothetical protein [Thermoanaerobaculia bacterium]